MFGARTGSAKTANVRCKRPALWTGFFVFQVYEIIAEGHRIIFAAGEFSNGIYGFYTPDA